MGKRDERELEEARRATELGKCCADFCYFCETYCFIEMTTEDGKTAAWRPFKLWDAQREVAEVLCRDRLVVMLKARQLGFTWIALAYALWRLTFHPIATVLLFSERDDEARELLAYRMKGVHLRLPDWMRDQRDPDLADSDHEWELPSGSRALAFSTKGGRSYTATLAIIDEADNVEDLNKMLSNVKPTIDAGGQLFLISTSNKQKPESSFKKLYCAARDGQNNYTAVFKIWSARPDRTLQWYEEQRSGVLSRTGALDLLWQEYPNSDMESLAPASADKRLPAAWLNECYAPTSPLSRLPNECPSLPGLEVFQAPRVDGKYVIGADPAEGKPTSDDSAAVVLDAQTGEHAASLRGKIEPSDLGERVHKLARYFNRAHVLVERNNHGHAVLLWLRDNARDIAKLHGHHPSLIAGHDKKPGWVSSQLGKTSMYDTCADMLKNKEVLVRCPRLFAQLASVEAATLRPPDGAGHHGDLAVAFALACCARLALGAKTVRFESLAEPKEEDDGKINKMWEGGPTMEEYQSESEKLMSQPPQFSTDFLGDDGFNPWH
jgi:hypothetical protein